MSAAYIVLLDLDILSHPVFELSMNAGVLIMSFKGSLCGPAGDRRTATS
jgi:hypothetical protein